jgi:hypothetical protein
MCTKDTVMQLILKYIIADHIPQHDMYLRDIYFQIHFV